MLQQKHHSVRQSVNRSIVCGNTVNRVAGYNIYEGVNTETALIYYAIVDK